MTYTPVFNPPVNATDFLSQLTYINSTTDVGFGGVFGIVILIIVQATLFLVMKAFTFDRAMAVSMMITSVIGLFLRILGLINDNAFYTCLILLVASLWMLLQKSSQGEV